MNIAFVVGNGISRTKIADDWYADRNTYSCNLTYQNFTPKNLVICDRPLLVEAISQNAHLKSKVWTRDCWKRHVEAVENVYALPNPPYKAVTKHDQPMNWGSGLYAALLACLDDNDLLVFIGFDLWPISLKETKKVNNVYAGHNGYGPKDAGPVDPSGWIYQFTKLFELFPNKQFVFINKNNWRIPEEWKTYENFNLDTFDSLNSL